MFRQPAKFERSSLHGNMRPHDPYLAISLRGIRCRLFGPWLPEPTMRSPIASISVASFLRATTHRRNPSSIFLTLLFVTIRAVPVQQEVRRRGAHTHRHYARGEARGGDSAEDVAEQRRLAINFGGIGDWQGEQAGGEGPCCSDRQQPRPSPNDGSDGCCTIQREGSACSCSSQQLTTGRSWQLQHSSVRQPRCRERSSGTATPARTQGT